VFVDFVSWAIGENLLFPPTGDRAKVVTLDKVLKGLVVRPLARNKVGITITNILPECRGGMSLGGVEGFVNSSKLFFKSSLFARQSVIIHADSDHGFVLLKKVCEILQAGYAPLDDASSSLKIRFIGEAILLKG